MRTAQPAISRVMRSLPESLNRLLSTTVTALVTAVALVAPAHAAFVSISGGAASGIPVSNDGMTVTSVEVAGARCDVRGLIAYDADGQRLVCVPPSRAIPSELEWRPVG